MLMLVGLLAQAAVVPPDVPQQIMSAQTAPAGPSNSGGNSNSASRSSASAGGGSAGGGLSEQLKQSPFGRLLDLPGIDGAEDIFGNVGGSGDGSNPFGGSSSGGGSASNRPYGGNPFAGDNFSTIFGGGSSGGSSSFGGGGSSGNPFGGSANRNNTSGSGGSVFTDGNTIGSSGGGTTPASGGNSASTSGEGNDAPFPFNIARERAGGSAQLPSSSGEQGLSGDRPAGAASGGGNSPAKGSNPFGGSSTGSDPDELLKQSPFAPLFDLPGIDSAEDIFGNVDAGGSGNPFSGEASSGPPANEDVPSSSNPFTGGGDASGIPINGNNVPFGGTPPARESDASKERDNSEPYAVGTNLTLDTTIVADDQAEIDQLLSRPQVVGTNTTLKTTIRTDDSGGTAPSDSSGPVIGNNISTNDGAPKRDQAAPEAAQPSSDKAPDRGAAGEYSWRWSHDNGNAPAEGNPVEGGSDNLAGDVPAEGTSTAGPAERSTSGNAPSQEEPPFPFNLVTQGAQEALNKSPGDGKSPGSDNETFGNGNWYVGTGNETLGNGNWHFGSNNKVVGNGNWVFGDDNTVVGNGNWYLSRDAAEDVGQILNRAAAPSGSNVPLGGDTAPASSAPGLDGGAVGQSPALGGRTAKAVPEPSSVLGTLAFGVLGSGAWLKRKWKLAKRFTRT